MIGTHRERERVREDRREQERKKRKAPTARARTNASLATRLRPQSLDRNLAILTKHIRFGRGQSSASAAGPTTTR